ncbi:MAG: hydrolase, partial [Gammaproteobacteria bacterium]|nr:hydrolase [Gammaproteobacteria bacterium]
MINRETGFKPVWWLRSPHIQTLWPAFFKKKHVLELRDEQLELEDGDFIDLCWSRKKSEKVVLLLHGLEGGIRS